MADSRHGLSRLRETHITATLPLGSIALLIHVARAGRVPFDAVLSAEPVHSFKPDPKVYQMAADPTRSRTAAGAETACHLADLRAADSDLRTAYIPRPLEWGPPFDSTRAGPGRPHRHRHPRPGPTTGYTQRSPRLQASVMEGGTPT
ncbi:hypothetical protein OG806_47490 [Streptomyces sp. NBC_00882]|uniref:hypothetical protein n=1 Tax=Streptomyces sp. NBC_00882 TaxID=2975856 RepID=UPI0038646E49|nr:hypothetical protein OG806_47490 [Streptomyces sp. NBC_00882]